MERPDWSKHCALLFVLVLAARAEADTIAPKVNMSLVGQHQRRIPVDVKHSDLLDHQAINYLETSNE
jgi:hypothetical protein